MLNRYEFSHIYECDIKILLLFSILYSNAVFEKLILK